MPINNHNSEWLYGTLWAPKPLQTNSTVKHLSTGISQKTNKRKNRLCTETKNLPPSPAAGPALQTCHLQLMSNTDANWTFHIHNNCSSLWATYTEPAATKYCLFTGWTLTVRVILKPMLAESSEDVPGVRLSTTATLPFQYPTIAVEALSSKKSKEDKFSSLLHICR